MLSLHLYLSEAINIIYLGFFNVVELPLTYNAFFVNEINVVTNQHYLIFLFNFADLQSMIRASLQASEYDLKP